MPCLLQEEDTDAAQVVDPRVQTGNRDKRAKRAFNFVEEGTYVKQVTGEGIGCYIAHATETERGRVAVGVVVVSP